MDWLNSTPCGLIDPMLPHPSLIDQHSVDALSPFRYPLLNEDEFLTGPLSTCHDYDFPELRVPAEDPETKAKKARLERIMFAKDIFDIYSPESCSPPQPKCLVKSKYEHENPLWTPTRFEEDEEMFHEVIEIDSDLSEGEATDDNDGDDEEENEERRSDDENVEEVFNYHSGSDSSEGKVSVDEEDEEEMERQSEEILDDHDEDGINSDRDEADQEVEEERELTTPERWALQEENMCFTQRMFEMEMEQRHAKPRSKRELLFTVVESPAQFMLIAPFGPNPLYLTVSYPVEDDLMGLLAQRLPNAQFWLNKLMHEGEFAFTGQWFEFKGDSYRRDLLMDRAYYRAIREPEMKEKRDNVIISPDSLLRCILTKAQRRQKYRAMRIAATAAEGATPTGRRLPKRAMRLFEEEPEENRVKRRRIEFDD